MFNVFTALTALQNIKKKFLNVFTKKDKFEKNNMKTVMVEGRKIAVVPKTNVTESKKTPIKVKDNPVTQARSDQPIWTRQLNVIEYDEFYISVTKDKDRLENQPNIVVEGEMTFKPLHIISGSQSTAQFEKSEQAFEKRHVRRVFTTDDFKDMMPSYISFVKSNSNSDDMRGIGSSKSCHQQAAAVPQGTRG